MSKIKRVMDRYSRQMILPEVGVMGQQRLSEARVLIVGVGGLGSPVALYLAAAGVGTIGIVDDDVVSVSNLQRQILYVESDVDCVKANVAAERLKALNGGIEVVGHNVRLTEDNAAQIISQYDIVVDGCDNYQTRFLIDRICAELSRIYIYGAIEGFVGQVSVFCNGKSGRYADFCAEQGESNLAVMGTTAAVVGAVEASECIKIICGYGEPLYNHLWMIDLRTMQSNIVEL